MLLPRALGLVALLLALAALGMAPSPTSAASEVSPETFAEVSSGVALIRTYGCRGKPLGQGTGFLVGTSVVMTARHVVVGACRVRVRVSGADFVGKRTVFWYGGGASTSAADLATIKLDRAVQDGYVFRVRSNRVPPGLNLGTAGYPLGNKVSFNQGKIIWRGKVNRAPALAVRMLGAEGASGSPFFDRDGRVVGILQIGLGKARDVLGQRTSGVLMGLDLVRWWGPHARLDLCRAYPGGGIAGCPGTKPPPPASEVVEVTAANMSGTEDGSPQSEFSTAPSFVAFLQIEFASATTKRHTFEAYTVSPVGSREDQCGGSISVGWEGVTCEVRLTAPTPGQWRVVYLIDGRQRAVGFSITGSSQPPGTSPRITQCWVQYTGGSTDNWSPTSAVTALEASDILGRGAANFSTIARMDPVPTADIGGGVVTLTLIQPNGQVFGSGTIPTWEAGYAMYGFTLRATWSDDGLLFFQHPERTGQGAWTFRWSGPGGQTCSSVVSIS